MTAALEAAERAELDTAQCWERFGQFQETVMHARTEKQLAALAMRLLVTIKPGVKHTGKGDGGFAALNAIVSARLVDGITLNEVSDELGQTPSAITRRLQRRFGLSFSQYVGRLRIDMAKELLRRTQLGVGNIARRVGVNDQSNFTKLFRKFENMSPLDYRRRTRKKT